MNNLTHAENTNFRHYRIMQTRGKRAIIEP